ncbi:MAG: dehypoxanthine futalosine cyclase [Bacteroidota bacterium]
MHSLNELYQKALAFEFLTPEEGLYLYDTAPTPELMFVANELRKKQKPDGKVSWIIDRNANITNVCVARCQFCNFYRTHDAPDTYITTIDEYREKIEFMLKLGGKQLLLQGGHHPKLGLAFYTDLFKQLKTLYPEVKLHALGPPEIVHISRLEKMSYRDVLIALREAGHDSLPGAGAEILVDRVRKEVAKGKASAQEWLDVMREAHKLGIVTSATMMFGHVETKAERIEHLVNLRTVQAEKPDFSDGFTAFIPWPFQDEGTQLKREKGVTNGVLADEYIRTIAISRIMLPNVKNIQASWLTVGKEIAQICLHSGANDFGSIMIEENVVSAAGADYSFDALGIQQAIRDAGFEPQMRNQAYEFV